MYYNEQVYVPEKYDDEGPVNKEVGYSVLPLNSLQPVTKTFQL